MPLNLKRKRSEAGATRKVRKVEDEHKDSVSEVEDENNDEAGDTGVASDSDEEEWTGIGLTPSEPQTTTEVSGKPNKPPMGDELRVIKDASDLFRSNSFKLQIDALLPNVRPKASRIPPLDRFLLSLHTFIMEIPSISQKHPLEASKKLLKKGIAVPYSLPLPTEDTNWKVGYEQPSDIVLVGSWANKVSVKPKDGLKYGVDLAIEMPDGLFQEKDYLNGRFFQKRAFYLATIASALKISKTIKVNLSYESPSGDPRLTNLVLIPKKDNSVADFTKLNAKIVITPIVSPTCPIPINRLSPSHSNLRLSSSSSNSSNAEQESSSTSRHIPSPTYNNTLLRSFVPKSHLLITHTLKNESPAFSDALTLLRVWANQRGFTCGATDSENGNGSGRMSVRGFENMGVWWIGILSLVVFGEEDVKVKGKNMGNGIRKRKALGRGLSSYQMFKAALDFLAKFEFEKEAVFVRSKTGHRFSPEEYDVQQGPVFIDSTSLVNLLCGVPHGSLELLRYEAAKTLDILNQTTVTGDSFTEVFLKEQRYLPTRFDAILRVDLSNAKPKYLSLDSTLDNGSSFNAVLESLDKLLHQSLSNRTKSITILHHSSLRRQLNQAHPENPNIIYIGLIYHPINASRLVDYGPSVDQVEVEGGGGGSNEEKGSLNEFRKLWGPKAELRRFKDGRILESVVWEVKTVDERVHIPILVVRYVLEYHFGISITNANANANADFEKEKTTSIAIKSWESSFDKILRLPEQISSIYLNGGLPVGFKKALEAFDKLGKEIKKLDDDVLPLSILNLNPISDWLRYTSVLAPIPLPSSSISTGLLPTQARYTKCMEVIVEFEKSSRWPDDLKAIQKIKLAFLVKVAEGLMNSVNGLKANVVIGEGGITSENELLDQVWLQVLTEEGWAFCLRIWNDRECVLLDRIIDGSKSLLPHIKMKNQKKEKEKELKGKEWHDAVLAKEVYMRRFIFAPRHHRAVNSLCHRYSAFAGTVRLVKRWLGAHWVLGGSGVDVGNVVGNGSGSGNVSEEAVEMLCANVFIGDGKALELDVDSELAVKQPIPNTKERGFALVVEFLKDWKWEEGVYVPLYGAQQKKEGEQQEEGGDREGEKKQVKASSNSAWTIMTELDKEGKVWTKNGPDVIVARRVQMLAKATWEYLQGVEQGELDVQAMFIHPTEDYDVVIELDKSALPRYAHNVVVDTEVLTRKGKYANKMLVDGSTDTDVRPGFDPAKLFFNDLQRIYADTFKIFCDPYGGDRFGLVWDPNLKQPRPFRVLGGFSSEPIQKDENDKGKDKGLVALNQDAILSEIERLGRGLVSKIIVA